MQIIDVKNVPQEIKKTLKKYKNVTKTKNTVRKRGIKIVASSLIFRRTVLLTTPGGGGMQLRRIGLQRHCNAKQAKLIQSQQFIIKKICNVFYFKNVKIRYTYNAN